MENLDYIRIPIHNMDGVYTLVDGDYDGEYFSQFRWYLNKKTGYLQTRIHGETVTLHKLICKTPKGMYVDHKDRDKLNNRSCNLRAVTPSENRMNSKDYNNKRLTEEEKKLRAYIRRNKPDVRLAKARYDRERYIKFKNESNSL